MNHAAAGLVGGEDEEFSDLDVFWGAYGEGNTVGEQVDYTHSLLIFGVIGVCAIITASLLLWMDRKRHYGLESPNIS